MEPGLSKAGLAARLIPSDFGGVRKALADRLLIAAGRLDRFSLITALGWTAGYFALAMLCLSLWRIDATLASVWLPNAAMVAALLTARLRNEIVLLAGIFVASLAAHYAAGDTLGTAAVLALAHLVDVALVTCLVRKSSLGQSEASGLSRLGPVLQFGGVIGPIALCVIAAFALGPDWSALSALMLADSMGMILIVPAALVVAQVWRERSEPHSANMIERAVLMSGGLVAVNFVFQQNLYPLMFLIPPVTLLIAFRVGALGTALYVPGLALIAAWMTYRGIGPIAQSVSGEAVRTHLLQAFIAANFLTGLPIAAILSGRAQMTSELKRSRSELALLTESMSDAVLWIDSKRVCTYASPAVQQVLGRMPQDMIGQSLTVSACEDAQCRFDDVIGRLLRGDAETERLTFRRLPDREEDASIFIEADCAIVHDPTGEVSGIVVCARDVTERVELELELTRARSRAENAALAKSEFLANMSHEIRTPMNGVLGFAELMLQGDLDEKNRSHTQMIVQSGRSMMVLLNDILDLSKIEAGHIVIDPEPVDIAATIAECAALHRAAAEQKGLSLAVDNAASPPPWVMTDALRMRQIILNLVGNAVKFTEHGGVTITLECKAEQFSITVSDTGIGISPNRIETIFAPFTQAESNTARRFGGTGLGLSISRQLAELLGGAITVESEPGVGSTFRLTLPADYAEPAETAGEPEAAQEPPPLPQAARILLVEDHDVNRALGVEMLARCGQAVDVAHDGNEAIAMVIDSVMRETPYDLVLMDIQMPGCDGYAATRAIRADGIGPGRLPIIALTANAFPEDIAAARKAGMQAHLAKPLVFADLARALQRWLPIRIVETGAATPSRSAAPERPPPEPQLRAPTSLPETVFNAPPTPEFPPQTHSPDMLNRWNARRGEAIAAVRDALENGALTDKAAGADSYEGLARLLHKLAGTAAIFGEPKLGDQAAAFEHALKMQLSAEVREALAFKLLSIADDPPKSQPPSGA